MKRLMSLYFLLIVLSAANAQNTYTLKESDISFKSSEQFLAMYDNPGYAVYKNDRIELTMSIIRFVNIGGLEKELAKRLPEKEYTVYDEAFQTKGQGQKGLFSFAERKGYSSHFAIGLIAINDKTILVEIKFDAPKEDEVESIIKSFFRFDNPTANQVAQIINNDKLTKPSQPIVDSKPLPETKPTNPKHPAVSHPNLLKLSAAQQQEFINAHNRWRSDVGVPPLSWSTDLENYAGEWAIKKGEEGCVMEHRPPDSYGENLYWSSGMEFSPKGSVDSWGSEIKDYHGEVIGKSKGVVGHYTQIVWRTTTEVGCAAFQCGRQILVVCNYNPPGNWVGEHPYK